VGSYTMGDKNGVWIEYDQSGAVVSSNQFQMGDKAAAKQSPEEKAAARKKFKEDLLNEMKK
jgi:hypothetical protein